MELTKEVLKIDPKKVSSLLVKFIQQELKKINREGIVVPISGGLDSSVVAALCVKAVGKDKVIGLMLPEKEGNPEAEKYGKLISQHLQIKTKTFDISNILKLLGTYNFILSYIPSRDLKENLVKYYIHLKKIITNKNPFVEATKGTKNKFIMNGISNFHTKPMVRLLVAYKFAEADNLLLMGSDQKTETMLGLFAKFDNSDLAPMKNLYRSQVIQIAEFLNLPKEIINRSPNPDIIPGVKDKYLDLFGISSDKIDLILIGLENKMNLKDIAKQVELNVKEINEIKKIVKLTEHMRIPSIAPEL